MVTVSSSIRDCASTGIENIRKMFKFASAETCNYDCLKLRTGLYAIFESFIALGLITQLTSAKACVGLFTLCLPRLSSPVPTFLGKFSRLWNIDGIYLH